MPGAHPLQAAGAACCGGGEGGAAAGEGAVPVTVAVLFARADSVYKTMPGADVWDMARDARRWPGGAPVVAHPPCRAWGGLSHMAKPRPDERGLALFAVARVRMFGGVLEHPKRSKLWPVLGLPAPGAAADEFGGWTLAVNQSWWGHRAEKATLLYIVGCSPDDVPPFQRGLSVESHVIGSSGRRADGTRKGGRPECSKAEREHTPPAFAQWLFELAQRCERRQ